MQQVSPRKEGPEEMEAESLERVHCLEVSFQMTNNGSFIKSKYFKYIMQQLSEVYYWAQSDETSGSLIIMSTEKKKKKRVEII